VADSADREPQDDTDAGQCPSREQTMAGGVLPWMITLLVAVLCAGAGLALGRLVAASRVPDRAEVRQENFLLDLQTLEEDSPAADPEKNWYYDLQPVTVNLDEPTFRHHVRASVTLEISGEVDPSKGRTFLERKKTLMANRLTICLAGLSRQDLRGEGSIERVQLQIRDVFNEELFPESKPRIKQVLLKHLAVQ